MTPFKPDDQQTSDAEALDIKLKRLDRKLKLAQIASENRKSARTDSTALIVGIIAALVGFLGNVLATYFQGRNASDIERQKQQGSLIIESIKTGNPESAARNLRFLLQAGLIDDPKQKLSVYLAQQQQVPVLPARDPIVASAQPVNSLPVNDVRRRLASAVAEITAERGGCTGFLVANNKMLTAGPCVDRAPGPLRPTKAVFGYITESTSTIIFAINRVDEFNPQLNYALLTLDGEPGKRFGVIPLQTRAASVGEAIFVVHHSRLGPQYISPGVVTSVSSEQIEYSCDTAPGSSGSPVIAAADLSLLAIHVSGDPNSGVKRGTPVLAILQQSPGLRSAIPQRP